VPVAASLVAAGLPLGAVIVFLMAGPATNAATVGAVYRGLGRRALVTYLTTIIAGSIVAGVLFDWLLGDAGFTLAGAGLTHEHGHAAAWWETAAAVALLAWLAACAVRDLRKRFTKEPETEPAEPLPETPSAKPCCH